MTNAPLLRARFDTDSVHVTVDNGATCTMTPDASDFLPGSQRRTRMKIKGLGETVATTKGTVAWAFLDDTGKRSVFTIPDVLHVPSLQGRLLSPQHWAQHIGHHAHCITTATAVHLIWQQGKGEAHKTILLNEANIGVMRTAPSTKGYMAFKAQAHTERASSQPPQDQVYCFPAVDSPEAEEKVAPTAQLEEPSHEHDTSNTAKEGE